MFRPIFFFAAACLFLASVVCRADSCPGGICAKAQKTGATSAPVATQVAPSASASSRHGARLFPRLANRSRCR